MRESISVVIPVYRSAAILPELYARLVDALHMLGGPYEIIFVEDCGGDGSWNTIKDLATRDARVRGFRLSRNYGQHNAILCGIRKARHDVTVTMDDDLQHPPDQIGLLVAGLRDGCDVVYGVAQVEQHGLLRNLASRFTKMALQSAMGAENARNVSAFRAFRTELREAFKDFQNPFVSIDVLLSWATGAFGAVKVRHERRRAGISNYTVGKLINHAFNLLTEFSAAPLRLVSIVWIRLHAVRLRCPCPRARRLSDLRLAGTGLRIFGNHRHVVLGRAAFHPWHLWRISGANLRPHHGSAGLCDEGNHGRLRTSS